MSVGSPPRIVKVHLIGIGGTGMGAVAGLLAAAGHEVRGSDAAVYPPMSEQLAALGVPVELQAFLGGSATEGWLAGFGQIGQGLVLVVWAIGALVLLGLTFLLGRVIRAARRRVGARDRAAGLLDP